MTIYRADIQDDLALYAELLGKADPSGHAFDTVLDEVSQDLYAVSLHEFISIMERVGLNDESRRRLELVKQLDGLIYPHIPELAPFAGMWALVARPDVAEYVNVERTITYDSVAELFDYGSTDRIGNVQDQCVMFRTAVAMRDWNEDQVALLAHDNFSPVLQAFTHESEESLKAAYDEAMENFSGDREDFYDLPAYPEFSSSQCDCLSPYASVELLLKARGLFDPAPPSELRKNLKSTRENYWSTITATDPEQINSSVRSEDFFVFSTRQVSEPDNWEYLIAFAIGEVSVSFTTLENHPAKDMTEWTELWDERTDMIQYLMDIAEGRAKKFPWDPSTQPNRKYIWSFRELPEAGPETQSENMILIWNENTAGYDQHFPLAFSDGFYILKNAIREELNF